MVALPNQWGADGFAAREYVLAGRDEAGAIRLLGAGDMVARIDVLPEGMIEMHTEALDILAKHGSTGA